MSGTWQPPPQPQPFGYGPQGYPPFGYAPHPVPPPVPARGGMPTWLKVLLILFVIGAVLVILVCAGLIWLGANTPSTAALPGPRVPQKYLDEIAQLGLLEEGETIQYFYSDAMLDITDGMYFFTDRAVVMYSTLLDPSQPLARFEFADIVDIRHEDTDSFWTDSTIWVETDEEYFYFPVSNEAGGDEQFFNLLLQTWEAQRDGSPNE